MLRRWKLGAKERVDSKKNPYQWIRGVTYHLLSSHNKGGSEASFESRLRFGGAHFTCMHKPPGAVFGDAGDYKPRLRIKGGAKG